MSGARLIYEKRGDEAHIRFDNPAAHNALTSQMWHDLRDAAYDIAADRSIRVAVFRGVGGNLPIEGDVDIRLGRWDDPCDRIDYAIIRYRKPFCGGAQAGRNDRSVGDNPRKRQIEVDFDHRDRL